MMANRSRLPTLILSPHPDDAVLGCWSVFEREAPVCVINVFAGVPPPGTTSGWDATCGVPDSAEMMRRRRAEDETALRAAGAAPIQLPFLDGQYRDSPPDLDAIALAIKDAVPRWRRLYAPSGAGGWLTFPGTEMTLEPHPDHQSVREVALRLSPAPRSVHFFAEIPYALQDSEPAAWARGIDRFTAELEAATGRPLKLARRLLSQDAVLRRLRALDTYITQVPAIDSALGGLLRHPEVLRLEAYWS